MTHDFADIIRKSNLTKHVHLTERWGCDVLEVVFRWGRQGGSTASEKFTMIKPRGEIGLMEQAAFIRESEQKLKKIWEKRKRPKKRTA